MLLPIEQYRKSLDTLLAESGIFVDASQSVHDSQRILSNGSPSHSLIMKYPSAEI